MCVQSIFSGHTVNCFTNVQDGSIIGNVWKHSANFTRDNPLFILLQPSEFVEPIVLKGTRLLLYFLSISCLVLCFSGFNGSFPDRFELGSPFRMTNLSFMLNLRKMDFLPG